MDYSTYSSEDLVKACIDSTFDNDVWVEFIHRFGPLIRATVMRTARRWLAPDTASLVLEEIFQDICITLLDSQRRVLSAFTPNTGRAIEPFLKVIAAHVAIDYVRSRRALKRGADTATSSIDYLPDRDLYDPRGESVVERNLFLSEVNDQLKAVTNLKKEREMFWLYYRHGLTAKEIAGIPGIGLTSKGVESVIFKLTSRIRRALNAVDSVSRPAD